MRIQHQRGHLSRTPLLLVPRNSMQQDKQAWSQEAPEAGWSAYRGEHGVVLGTSGGRAREGEAWPGERRRRGRREADDGRAPAGAGVGAGIGAALEERGVERAQLSRLGDGGLDVLARGRERWREVGGGGGGGGVRGHGDGAVVAGSGSKAARRALGLVAPRRGALQLLLLAAGGPEEGAASRHWGLEINVLETLEGS
jgi:hypothetical protein